MDLEILHKDLECLIHLLTHPDGKFSLDEVLTGDILRKVRYAAGEMLVYENQDLPSGVPQSFSTKVTEGQIWFLDRIYIADIYNVAMTASIDFDGRSWIDNQPLDLNEIQLHHSLMLTKAISWTITHSLGVTVPFKARIPVSYIEKDKVAGILKKMGIEV